LFSGLFCFRESAAIDSSNSSRRTLAIAAFGLSLLWLAAAWFVSESYYDQRATELVQAITKIADHQADSIAAGIERILVMRRGIALTLADDDTIRRVALQRLEGMGTNKAPAAPASLNRFLGSAERNLNVDALWIGDARGVGLAALAENPRDSPIGVDYSDRIYFREAKAGRVGYQFAVGRTTGRGGFYFSAPIRAANRFAGFVLTKTNISRLAGWISQADTLVSDDHGVIVLANDPRWNMHLLEFSTIDRLTADERQAQYGRTEFSTLLVTDWPDRRHFDLKRVADIAIPQVVRAHALPQFGLTVTVMQPAGDLAAIDRQRLFAFSAAATVGVLLIIILSVSATYLQQVHASRRLLAQQKLQLDEAQQLVHLGSWEHDLIRNQVSWSEESRRIFELESGQYCSTYDRFLGAVHPADRELVDQTYRKSLTSPIAGEIVHRIRVPSGKVKVLHQRWRIHFDCHGQPRRSSGSVQDITESRLVEARLRLAASVFDSANEGICITDTEQRIIDVNPTLCLLTGYSREEIIGQTPRLFKSDRQDSAFYTAMWLSVANQGHWRGELWNRHRNGSFYAIQLAISEVRDDSGKPTHYIGIMVNITASKKHMDQLEHVAHFDALTGIPNRLLLADRIRQAIAHTHRGDTFLAVCYIDLDEFKPINDRYGHDVGDLALVEVAHRLSTCLRGGDTAARLGGDEFVLLLSDLHGADEYEASLHRILAEIQAPLVISGHQLGISASIGVVLCPQQSSDPEALLRYADQAMYQAKLNGKNRWQLYSPDNGLLRNS
jgi:diguanylate cyclase (GGDEF)-like protein/PAS domain S-box-containing protein